MRWRRLLFMLSAAGLLSLYIWGALGLPPLGVYLGPYGDIVNSIGEFQTHATEMVGVVNFDFRAFDTVVEEFILFSSVAGMVLLLRKHPFQRFEILPDHAPDRDVPHVSEAVRLWVFLLVGPTVAFGIYIVLHGHLTPGGGFQGGVILASVPLLVYLAGGLRLFHGITSHYLVEITKAMGAFIFLLIGWTSLYFGLPFLQNYLGRGQAGVIPSGGIIPMISGATGIEVTGAFLLIMIVFFEFVLLLGEEDNKRKKRRS